MMAGNQYGPGQFSPNSRFGMSSTPARQQPSAGYNNQVMFLELFILLSMFKWQPFQVCCFLFLLPDISGSSHDTENYWLFPVTMLHVHLYVKWTMMSQVTEWHQF